MTRVACEPYDTRAFDTRFVCSVRRVPPDSFLLVVTADGYGKRVPVAQIPRHCRGSTGVRVSPGQIAAALVVRLDDQ